MSPTMSTCTPVSECFESIVPKSDNQIDCGPLPSPPSPSSSTLSRTSVEPYNGACSGYTRGIYPLDES